MNSRPKVQNKEAEIDFFDQFNSYDFAPAHVYVKVAKHCHMLLNMKPGRILEAGCGTGFFGKKLAELGHNVIGIDLSSRMIEQANMVKVPNYSAKAGDLEDKELFPRNSFSIILSPGVLHHIPDLEKSHVIGNFLEWLKPGGFVVLWEPNGSNPVNKISKGMFRIYSLFYKNTLYATTNETNHTYWQYKRFFVDKGLKLISSETFSDKATRMLGSFLIRFMGEIRWIEILLTDVLLPFPWCGAMLFLSFKKDG